MSCGPLDGRIPGRALRRLLISRSLTKGRIGSYNPVVAPAQVVVRVATISVLKCN